MGHGGLTAIEVAQPELIHCRALGSAVPSLGPAGVGPRAVPAVTPTPPWRSWARCATAAPGAAARGGLRRPVSTVGVAPDGVDPPCSSSCGEVIIESTRSWEPPFPERRPLPRRSATRAGQRARRSGDTKTRTNLSGFPPPRRPLVRLRRGGARGLRDAAAGLAAPRSPGHDHPKPVLRPDPVAASARGRWSPRRRSLDTPPCDP
jgi:hypothetical protein